MNKFFRFPVHPFLFSLYPPLALIAHNIDQVNPSAMMRSIVAVLFLAAILLLLAKPIFKDWGKAGLASTWFLGLFYIYGHIYLYLKLHPIITYNLGRHRLLVPVWLLLLTIGIWFIWKKRGDLRNITPGVNIVGLILIILPISQWIRYESQIYATHLPSTSLQLEVENTTTPPLPPDIYFIVMDSYAREDVLKKVFQYDNTPFIQSLRELGFYVASCSQSNYSLTALGMISELNMDYLQNLGVEFQTGNKFSTRVYPYLQHSLVRSFLENKGYMTVAFETGYRFSEIRDADVFFSQKRRGLSNLESIQQINGFEGLLIKTSGAIVFTDVVGMSTRTPSLFPVVGSKSVHRARVLYTLDKLKGVPLTVKSPKFVIAHIIAPHVPLVFGPNGEPLGFVDIWNQKEYRKAYTGEIEYLSNRLLLLLKELLTLSARPPVIILQSDHGYESAPQNHRMLILNAIYLPGVDESLLYNGISPINTFRLIFNSYFDIQLPLLEDISYYSKYVNPYNFTTLPQGLDCVNQTR